MHHESTYAAEFGDSHSSTNFPMEPALAQLFNTSPPIHDGDRKLFYMLAQVLRNQSTLSQQLAIVIKNQQDAIDLSGVLDGQAALSKQLDAISATLAAMPAGQAAIDQLTAAVNTKTKALEDAIAAATPK